MASFQEDEYLDHGRIERGYDAMHLTLVPNSLNLEYGALNQILRARFRYLNVDAPEIFFRICDGVGLVHENNIGVSSPEFLETILDSKFHSKEISTRDLVESLREQAQKNENGSSLMYLRSPSGQGVAMVLHMKDDILSAYYHKVVDGKYRGWQETKMDDIFGPPNTIGFDHQGISTGLFLNHVLKNAGYQPQRATNEGDPGALWSLDVMPDRGIYREDILKQLQQKYHEQLFQDRDAQLMCLMATQVWVEPVNSWDGNIVKSHDPLRQALGEDYLVEGNCVEQSSALAINNLGGIDGRFVHPRVRVLPSQKALTQDSVDVNLYMLDPLHNQTLSARVFGNPPILQGNGTLEEQDITEYGALVRIDGHQYFAKQSNEGIDVYDSARFFFGSHEDYDAFLEAKNVGSWIHDVIQVQPLDRETRDFYRMCKQPYFDSYVIRDTINIFEKDTSNRTLAGLYDAWNLALQDKAGLIASSMSDDNIHISSRNTSKDNERNIPIGAESLNDMFSSQETCFITGTMNTPYGSHIPFVFFKKDGNQFFSSGENSLFFGRDDRTLTADNYTFNITGFGGNEFERMNEFLLDGVQRTAMQMNQQSIDT